MGIPTIDREDAVELFRQLLDPETRQRILRLLGEAKMGKSHLLTKVFPTLVQQHAARCAVLDLRNRGTIIIEHLHNACSDISRGHFSSFDQAHAEWIRRPDIQVTGLRAFFSIISARSRSREDDADRIIPHLTRCFVDDLGKFKGQLVVLIFDQVDDAAPETQRWLLDSLLVQLQSLSHVRVVVGGRTLPEVSGSYATCCRSYALKPVQKESAYIDYCREVRASLVEQSIRDLAKVFDYAPGAFAEAVTPFCAPKDSSNG